jgi:uncharacterized protein YbbK (DUF523 family)
MNRNKVLVSACLLGERVRYDGSSRPVSHPVLEQWKKEERLVSVCPEMLGGLLVPRLAAEIQPDFDGQDIFHEAGKVVTRQGHNVSQYFVRGARKTLELSKQADIAIAILKANSPSCGNEQIYSGEFSKALRNGQGVTAAALTEAGIKVFNEHQLDQAQAYLSTLEQKAPVNSMSCE